MPQEQPQQNSGTTAEECEDEPKSKEEGSESEESGSSKAASASVEGGGRPQAAAASSAVAEQGEAPEASPYAAIMARIWTLEYEKNKQSKNLKQQLAESTNGVLHYSRLREEWKTKMDACLCSDPSQRVLSAIVQLEYRRSPLPFQLMLIDLGGPENENPLFGGPVLLSQVELFLVRQRRTNLRLHRRHVFVRADMEVLLRLCLSTIACRHSVRVMSREVIVNEADVGI